MSSPFTVPQWDVTLTAVKVVDPLTDHTVVENIVQTYTGVVAETALRAEMKVWASLDDHIRRRMFRVLPSIRNEV